MHGNFSLITIAILASMSSCVAGLEHSEPMPEEQQLVPVNEAPELLDEEGSASVTNIRGTMPLLMRDSVELGVTESEVGEGGEFEVLEVLNGAEEWMHEGDTTDGLVLYDDGTFGYSGGTWGRSYNVLLSAPCPGYERSFAEAYTITGRGSCSVVDWYSHDTSDCRVVVHVGVPSFKEGTCAWQVYADQRGYYSYSASNTNSAQQNTVDTQIPLQAGNVIEVGTCGLPNASASGDTYLRLIAPNGQIAALNDDACSSLSSHLIYTVPPGAGGKYVVKAGCFASGACSGTVAWQIR
jgi:hypothetical protein